MWSLHVTYEDYVATTQHKENQMANSSSEDMDDYLIPGIGLRFELLNKNATDLTKDMMDGFSRCPTLHHHRDPEGSVKDIYGENNGQQTDSFSRLNTQCQKDNEPELINSISISHTCEQGKNLQAGLIDATAWSIDSVTIKSGKHRTNRMSKKNKDRKTTVESHNSSTLSSQISQIANHSRSSHYGQAPPSHHPYSFNSNNLATTARRRGNSPYRLKPIAYSKLQDKDTTDSCIKSPSVNKQMVNVSGGISTNKPARADRWEGGIDSRGSLKQTTVVNGPRREWIAHNKLNRMDKKTMMKRQCMYFPVDDYVTLSPLPASLMNSNMIRATNQADDKLMRGLTHEELREKLQRFSTDSYEKQLSPVTISSGYESDYSPPWPSDMEKVFSKRLETLNNKQFDDSHTDYFSQSEADHRPTEEPEKCASRLEKLAPGPSNQLTASGDEPITLEESFDGYDNLERSRSESTGVDKLVFINENHRYSLDMADRERNVVDTNKERLEKTKIYFEKYLLNTEKRGSTASLGLGHDSVKNVNIKTRSNFSLDLERHRDVVEESRDGEQQSGRLFVGNNGVRRSKRYRLDISRESLCKPKTSPVNMATDNKSNSTLAQLAPSNLSVKPSSGGDGEVPEVKSTPKRSPALGLASKMMSRVQSKNSCNIHNKCSLEEIKTNLSHDYKKCVGDSPIDNVKQVMRNIHNPGCVKSPRGRYDSDYEHIYDVIPGDENVFSPQRYYQMMATNQIVNPVGPKDLRRPRQVYREDPPALPARSYLKSKGDNQDSTSSARVECSSVDELYAKVNINNKHVNKTDGLYTSPIKARQKLFDSSNKENVFIPSMKIGPFGDYDFPETYCRISSMQDPEVTKWSYGDMLNFIDGIQQPEPKRRENIYCLLSNRQTRAKLSESLEIENKLVNMGLLRNSWSSENSQSKIDVEEDEKPPKLPPRVPLNNLQPIYV
ncbi:hypothetical protein SNE40_015462 [Patella caerulea]|uniref:Uncharacterized protein n=1 Tax=Patella caerulea TaxID=87958 RepID=A0AAN8PL00_PATCE